MFKIIKALHLWFTQLTTEEKQIVIEYYQINKEIKSMAAKLTDVLAELTKRAQAHDDLQKEVDSLTVENTNLTDRLAELEPLATALEQAESDLGIVIPDPVVAPVVAPVADGSNIVPAPAPAQ